MNFAKTDLDVATPEDAEQVLRAAAQQYREATGELQSAWGDQGAGVIWSDYARILERAADSMARARARRGV